jgi:hypothetical protein
MVRKKPRRSKLMSLHPAEIAFLLDDDSYCRPSVPRDRASLKSLKGGGRQVLFGEQSPTARELLTEYREEAMQIYQAANPGKLPSWWGMLSDSEKRLLKI